MPRQVLQLTSLKLESTQPMMSSVRSWAGCASHWLWNPMAIGGWRLVPLSNAWPP